VSIHLHPPIHENIDENKKLFGDEEKKIIINSHGSADGDE
jgi:hypothetical protein